MVRIELTREEDDRAVEQAIVRQYNAITHKAHGQFMPANSSRLQILRWNIQGARGEIAACRYFEKNWSGEELDGRLRRDVADAIEVRTTERPRNLIVKHLEQQKNPPGTPYVLAWADPFSTQVDLVGWITLGSALDEGEHYEARGVWYSRVPWQKLHDTEGLRHLWQGR